jgi:uncharacterized protein (TIGR02118 family)
MDKVIFVLHRRADLTREECLDQWAGERHVSVVKNLPGLVKWRQNHVISAPGEAICDGIGELWFTSADAMNAALASPEMASPSTTRRTSSTWSGPVSSSWTRGPSSADSLWRLGGQG